MSVITKIEFIDQIRIKRRNIEDNFMGYKITTSDDTNDNIISEDLFEKDLNKIKDLKNKLEELYNNYTDDMLDKIVETTNQIYQLEELIKLDHPSESYELAIKTNKFKNVSFMINNHKSCCEHFGVEILCPYNLNQNSLIGATIKNIKYANMAKKSDYECIIDLSTDKGVFKFRIYNEHNGYYPHDYYYSFNNFYTTGEL